MHSDAQGNMALLRTARESADHMLRHYLQRETPPEPTSLETASDFDLTTTRLAADLQACAKPVEAAALTALLERLDTTWNSRTDSQTYEVIEQALNSSSRRLAPIGQALSATFAASSAGIFAAVRSDLRRLQHLRLRGSPSALDTRMMQFVRRSETLFVRDAYGKRMARIGAAARGVVAQALAQGLGRRAIGDLLAEAASEAFRQPATYWQVVAGAFVGRSRSYAQMSGYTEAGIVSYRVVAVMDERTSSVCRRMHGRVLRVQDGLHMFQQAEAAKDGATMLSLNPWPRRGATHADTDLTFPPYHALCRTSTVCHT